MKCGELGEGDFNAEIAAAYHYSVALFADFLYVIYAGAVLYFGDYVYAVAAVLAEKCLEVNEILPARNKRRRDIVDVILNTEQQILLVLLA